MRGATPEGGQGALLEPGWGVGRRGFLGWPCHLPMHKPLKVFGPQFPHLDDKGAGLGGFSLPLSPMRTGLRELVSKNIGS